MTSRTSRSALSAGLDFNDAVSLFFCSPTVHGCGKRQIFPDPIYRALHTLQLKARRKPDESDYDACCSASPAVKRLG